MYVMYIRSYRVIYAYIFTANSSNPQPSTILPPTSCDVHLRWVSCPSGRGTAMTKLSVLLFCSTGR